MPIPQTLTNTIFIKIPAIFNECRQAIAKFVWKTPSPIVVKRIWRSEKK
jgi:hypothetical protein